MQHSSLPIFRQLLLAVLTLLFSALALAAQGQTATIQGRITNPGGQAVAGAGVGIKGTAQGANTDAEGNFQIAGLAAGSYTLHVRLVGFGSQERRVKLAAGETSTQNFVLTESTEQLQEVVVEGKSTNKFARKESEYVGKMPLQNLENPQVYATVGKELLTEQSVFTVDDALRNAPGVQRMWDATGRAGDGGGFYGSRGFILQSRLRNGIVGGVTSDIDAVNLEKLEVIKGPSATLFGSSLTSYGGLINRVTKKAYDTFGGEVSVSGGSYGFHRISADVNLVDPNAPSDQPKTLAFRLNTAYQYEDSFQDKGFGRSIAVAPTLTYRPTDRLTINLDAELMQGQNMGKQLFFFYSPVSELGVSRAEDLPLDYRKSYAGNGLVQSSRSANVFGQVNYRISPAFTSSTNLSAGQSFSDGFGPYFYLVSDAALAKKGAPVPAPGMHSLLRADQSTRNSTLNTYEVQQLFNGDFTLGNLRNRVVVGLDFLRLDNNIKFFGGVVDTVPLNQPNYDYSTFSGPNVEAFYAGKTPPAYINNTKSNTYSAFVSDVLNLTERLSVLAALRLDRYDYKGGILYGAVDPYTQTNLSPKLGVVFQPVLNRVALFANYQNSFNNQNGAYIDVNNQQQRAKAERANQLEGGVKLDAVDGRFSATVSYYAIKVKDVLRPTPTLDLPGAQTQDGNQVSNGVEVNLIANPFAGFNAVAGFSYNDSKLQKTAEITNGLRPNTASSPYVANLWLSYRLPEGLLQGLGFGFGGNYASENKVQNTTAGAFILPSYTVLNASAFYDQPRFRISAKVDNLTDKQYWVGYTTLSPQKLRSVVGSVAYKF
ncbi:TonB-dependent siderophore receptor [Hymenobacter aquaticus]|uniref:TonB-dependent siderophore receptor n=1 Tax=Hymenobacter aquaticus TaxID=1867101 RepID=A0A4Z0PTF1_9BACT|nr:TonB-dependent receptor [Hymenobacter aquaticus]TGE20291.1 TonB-dependent siderophore receptor [Hymenobacter aquaticus]